MTVVCSTYNNNFIHVYTILRQHSFISCIFEGSYEEIYNETDWETTNYIYGNNKLMGIQQHSLVSFEGSYEEIYNETMSGRQL